MSEQEILDAVAANPLPEKSTDLTIVRKKAVELRDLYLQKADLELQGSFELVRSCRSWRLSEIAYSYHVWYAGA